MAFTSPATDLLPRHPLIIGEKRLDRGAGSRWAHIYPATGAVTGELPWAGAADVDAAVAAARAAFPAWRALPGDKRRDLMLKLAALLEQNIEPLTQLLTVENGSIVVAGPFMVLDAV